MDEFKKDAFQDPYIDQSSGCLRNLLGIKDSKTLSKVESSFALMRSYELESEQVSLDKTFDLQHLKAIHKHLFQDVYDWAGQIREGNISKGETYFSPRSRIEKSAEYTFTKLKQENYLKGLDANDFSKRTGYYLGDINHIHPFREGNGRTQREFINQLAHYNGYYIEWKNVSQKQMIDASIEADKCNIKPLATLIRENLADRDIVLCIKQNRSYEGGYARLYSAEAGKKYDGLIIGITERHVVQALKDSPNHAIIHNRHSLSKTPEMDKSVEISYPHGDIGLVHEPEILKEKESSKARSLGENSHQHEEHEWER